MAKPRPVLLMATLAFALLFGLQAILANRDKLATNPTWRPAISQLCLLASCKLAAWRQPADLVLVQQAMVADPKHDNVLILQMSFRNAAQWPQPWPLIELRLRDVQGEVIGLRRFRPKDYLNDTQTGDIEANQTVSLELALQESSGSAVNFEIEFQ